MILLYLPCCNKGCWLVWFWDLRSSPMIQGMIFQNLVRPTDFHGSSALGSQINYTYLIRNKTLYDKLNCRNCWAVTKVVVLFDSNEELPVNVCNLNVLRTSLHLCRAELESRTERFDVIIGDLADPIEGGPCYKLYTKSFYECIVKPRLSQGGIFVTQVCILMFKFRGRVKWDFVTHRVH